MEIEVCDVLADTSAEAANMKVHADLLAALIKRVNSFGGCRKRGKAAGNHAAPVERPDAKQAREILP